MGGKKTLSPSNFPSYSGEDLKFVADAHIFDTRSNKTTPYTGFPESELTLHSVLTDAVSMSNRKVGAMVLDRIHGGYMVEIDLKHNLIKRAPILPYYYNEAQKIHSRPPSALPYANQQEVVDIDVLDDMMARLAAL